VVDQAIQETMVCRLKASVTSDMRTRVFPVLNPADIVVTTGHSQCSTDAAEIASKTPDIIDEHNGELVALAFEFRKPVIRGCIKQYATVLDSKSLNTRRSVVMTVLDDGASFMLADEILRTSTCAVLVYAYPLELDENTGWYRHDSLNRVLCKKYSKAAVSDEYDPMKDIAVMKMIGDDNPRIMSHIKCFEDNDFYYSIMKCSSSVDLFDYIYKQEAKGKPGRSSGRLSMGCSICIKRDWPIETYAWRTF
jgi:hypothetical protein